MSAQQPASRKRPAPGANPTPNRLRNTQHDPITMDDNEVEDWSQSLAMNPDLTFPGHGYSDPSGDLDSASYGFNGLGSHDTSGMNLGMASGADGDGGGQQLIPRNSNNHLAARNQTQQWMPTGDLEQSSIQEASHDDELEDEATLQAKIAEAKRENGKKGIPPFVQKLSSFVGEPKWSHLIRWSDSGKSFIVVDEDEFAKKLIPELFKHNNYASFVRQLNMYGFHKKVGLSDNSMRASERKAKAPSEYAHKYFRRDRPDLLWLVAKPKNVQGAKGTKKEKEADEESPPGDAAQQTPNKTRSGGPKRSGVADSNADGRNQVLAISQNQFQAIQNEIRQIQQTQRYMANLLKQLAQRQDQAEQREQRYQQQTAMQQALHDRHENSINALITFLGNLYNRGLDGGAAADNLSSIFQHAIPQNVTGAGPGTQQPHGSVVDVGDLADMEINPEIAAGLAGSGHYQGRPASRRPLALLPPPATQDTPSPAPTVSTPHSTVPPSHHPRLGNSTVHDGSQQPTPSVAAKTDATSPVGDDVMNIIHNSNARAAAEGRANRPLFTQQQHHGGAGQPAHFGSMRSGGATATPQLTNAQRDRMRDEILGEMSASAQHAMHPPTTSGAAPNMSAAGPSGGDGANGPSAGTGTSTGIPEASYDANREQIDLLRRMHDKQANRIAHMAEKLQPLSPTGEIPGLALDNATGEPSYFPSGTADSGANGETPMAPTAGDDFDMGKFLNGDDFAGSGMEGSGLTALPTSTGDQMTSNAPDLLSMDDVNFFDPAAASHPLGATDYNDFANFDDNFNFDPNNSDMRPPSGFGSTGLGEMGGDNAAQGGNDVEGGGRVVGSVSSEATSPAVTVGEDEDEDTDGGHTRKRKRVA